MSDEMRDRDRDHACDGYSGDLAELALGALAGRERARVLAHTESCPRCAEELEQLSRVADSLVQVAPDVEPPMGFEVRLFERMGVSPEPATRQKRHRLHRFRAPGWVAGGLAAAAAALAVALGLSLTSAPAPTATAQGHHARGAVVSAALVENGKTVGRVAFGGTKPWMLMMLEDSSAHGRVNCVVVTKDGATLDVGTFVARAGYGAWIAPLHVNPHAVRTAEVVSPSGTVVATATLG